MENEIVRGNCLIAEYMEAVPGFSFCDWYFPEPIGRQESFDHDGVFLEMIPSRHWISQELQYHSSWDWLMPVLKKIASGDEFIQAGISIILRDFDLQSAWKSVVEHMEYRKRTGK